MRTLATRFDRAGFAFEQVRREGQAAIYRKRSLESGHETLEVIEVKQQAARSAFGKDYPAKEMYPCDNDFGRLAWCCVTPGRANARFDALRVAQAARQSRKTPIQSKLDVNSGM